MQLLVSTRQGLASARPSPQGWSIAGRWLEERNVTCALAGPGWILAGTDQGVYRSTQGGRSWETASTGLTIQHIRWMASHPTHDNQIFVGTEPAGIFSSPDQGRTWHPRPEIESLNNQLHWFLPYSPAAGCVRGFAFYGQRIYAAVEVGGVLTSTDGGLTWRLAEGSDGIPSFGPPAPDRIHPDVHDVLVHPSDEHLVLAPTGGGVYRSNDAGKSWTLLHPDYCRALWVDPQDAGTIVAGPARNSSGAQGRIEISRDGGQTWQAGDEGAGSPWTRKMVERFTFLGGQLFAILANGQVLGSNWPRLLWRPVLADLAGVQSMAPMK